MDKSIIILDLDECLIHSMTKSKYDYYEEEYYKDPNMRGLIFTIKLTDIFIEKGTGSRVRYWGFRRPHLNTFLIFCFQHFDYVVVWSAGEYDYVHNITNSIFKGIGRPAAVFTRKDIEYDEDVSDKYHKPIQKVLQDPRFKGKVAIEKAYFLDDRESNFRTSPGNGIVIPPYKPDPRNKSSIFEDVCLLQFIQWCALPRIIAAPDIRKVKKNDIFTTKVTSKRNYEDSSLHSIDPRILSTTNQKVPFALLDMQPRIYSARA